MKNFWRFVKSHPKRSIVLGIILILVIFLVVKKHGENPGVSKYTVTRGNVVDSLELAGEVEPVESAEMAFTESGQVSRVYKKNGDTIKAGEKIIELDNSSLYADLKDAQANLDLVKGQTGISEAELDRDVENARIELYSSDLIAYTKDSANESTVPQISGRYDGEKKGEYNIEIEYSNGPEHRLMRYSGIENGSQEIVFYKSIPLGTHGLYISFTDGASIGDTWQVSVPNVYGANYVTNLNAYNKAVSSRDAKLSTNVSSQVSMAKVEQAQAQVDKIFSEINARIIKAPFDGVVSKVELKQGEIANALDVVAEVLSPGAFEVSVQVPEADIVNLLPGLPANVTLDAYGKENVFSAKLLSVDPSETKVDGVSVYKGKILFDQEDPRIVSGMTANVSIEKQKVENVIFVPKRFIEHDDSGVFVNLVKEDTTVKTPVILGLVGSDTSVEIKSGLAEGDVIESDFSQSSL